MDAINFQIKSREVELKLLNSHLFNNSKSEYNNDTEVKLTKYCLEDTIQLTKRKDKTYILVKFQHLYNLITKNNCHNAGMFNVSDCVESVKIFRALFDLTYDEGVELMPVSMENRVMFQHPNPIRFIENTSYFSTFKAHERQGDFILIEHKSKGFKLQMYHKGGQCKENAYYGYNTIVLEEQLKLNRSINNYYGITSLQDLEDVNNYKLMQSRLVKLASDLLILDNNIDYSNLTESDKEEYLILTNKNTWTKEGLKLDCERKGKKFDKNTFQNYKVRLNELYEILGVNPHNNIVKTIIEAICLQSKINTKKRKIHHLFNGVSSSLDNYNKEINISSIPSIPSIPSNINLVGGGVVGSDSDSVNTCNESNLINCTVTGVSLKLEREDKPDAIYIQTKTLRYLFENNPAKYQQIKHAFIKNSIHEPKFEKNEFSHIAKQIRNVHYNKFRYIARAGVNQIPLF